MAVQIAFGVLFILILILAMALFFIFWIVMLVDAATRKFKENSEKIVWILVVILTGIIGAFIYFFIVYREFKSIKWFWVTLMIMLLILAFLFLSVFFVSYAA